MARKAKPEIREDRPAAPATGDHFIDLTANLVASYVSRNQVPLAEVPNLIATFHNALTSAATGSMPEPDRKPAVAVKKSVADDYIICLEDGKKLRML